MGPTAAGKTELAIALRDSLPCELINVDSAQVFRDMDVGTAKPDADELARAPHRLMSFVDPADSYSAAQFRIDALREMKDILAAGRVPVLVGGTMLYFKSLLYGIATLPEADTGVRAEIEALAAAKGWEAVHRELAEVDPESAERIHINDPQRLQRALEVYRVSGKTMTAWHQQDRVGDHRAGEGLAADLPCSVVQMAITPEDRGVLHSRIAQRFERMMGSGLVEEVAALRARGDLSPSLPAIRAVGYRQVWDHLEGELSREDALERGIIATRQLAKRQLTWLRSWKAINWLHTDATGQRLLGPEEVAGKTPLEGAIYYLRNSTS